MQRIIQGSAHKIELGDKLFHAIVTSPPYYGLRSYSGEQEVEWPSVSYSPMPGLPPISFPGCDPDCEHEWGVYEIPPNTWGVPNRNSEPGTGSHGLGKAGNISIVKDVHASYCQKCGGWRGALGLEPTPEMYIGHLILCFRECMRVLRDDGVMWIVEGDSYVGGKGQSGHADPEMQEERVATGESLNISAAHVGGKGRTRPTDDRAMLKASGLKQGDLMLIPSRLALALQADGWTIRQELVWRKLSPMPESVSGTRWERHRIKVEDAPRGNEPFRKGAYGDSPQRDHAPDGSFAKAKYVDCPGCDTCNPNGGYVLRRGSWRHTRSHEMVIMATKGMGYFCNGDVVKEGDQTYTRKAGGYQDDGYERPFRDGLKTNEGGLADVDTTTVGRNPRDVLSPSSEPYKGAHYAVFPPDLITPFIRASVPSRCCPECGAGYAPVVEHNRHGQEGWGPSQKDHHGTLLGSQSWIREGEGRAGFDDSRIMSYLPTCTCGREDWVPGTVFDPFVGSGTTLMVARELMLDAVGQDISEEYLDKHAKPRGLKQTPSKALDDFPLFAGIVCDT